MFAHEGNISQMSTLYKFKQERGLDIHILKLYEFSHLKTLFWASVNDRPGFPQHVQKHGS